MNKIITLLILTLAISSNAQQVIDHISTAKNTSKHVTTIDHPITNGKPGAILIVTQKYGVYNDNEIGVWYSQGKWKIFNQNRKPIPTNARFNILSFPKNTAKAFVHTSTKSNTTKHMSFLNSALTNNKANALVFVTQHYGAYNTSNIGVWFNNGKWKLYNENTKQNLPIGTKFNVLVLNPSKNKVGDLNLFAFKYKNTSNGHVSNINTPLQFTNTTTLFTTPNWAGTYNPNTTGVWLNGTKWTIFNQNRNTLPKNVQFNVLATNAAQIAVITSSPSDKPKVFTKRVKLPCFADYQNISYTVKDDFAVYQGDIVLGSASNVVDPKPDPQLKKRDFSSYSNGAIGSTTQELSYRVSDGLIDRDWLWPFGIIPYKIRNGFSVSERQTILEAIQEINTRTHLNIVPNNGNYHFVYFLKDTGLSGAGSSRVGRVRIPQRIRLNSSPSKETVIHEILHAAGFWHEQSRSDRARHVKINWDNIDDDLKHNFETHSTTGYKITPYDPNSIMHYNGYAFSNNNMPTIVDVRTDIPVNGGTSLSAMDVDGINTIYETDHVDYVTRPITTLRYVKTTILRVQSDDKDGGSKTAIDFYIKNETGPGWDWRPGGSSNPTEWYTSGKVEESDNDILPNWQFRYAIPRNEEFAKVWLHLRDDDGLARNERTDENVDINYFPGITGIELYIRTTDGQIFLGDIDGVRRDINYIGQVGEELEVQGFEGHIKAKMTFKIEIE